jgi:HprK-related kinase B
LKSIKKISEYVLEGTSLRSSLHLKFHEIIIHVNTNSPELVENLDGYFGDFCIGKDAMDIAADIEIIAIEGDFIYPGMDFIKKNPDPPKTRIKEEYYDGPDGRIVRKVLTGMVFIFSPGINIAVGKCLENSNQVINFINNRYIEFMLKKGCLLFHAAAVSNQARGAAICGFSGMGKSTLALKLLERGLFFVSNDRLLASAGNSRQIEMYGVPKLPRVNPGTILSSSTLADVIPDDEKRIFEQIQIEDLWDVEHKYDIYIDRIFGRGKFLMQSQMHFLFILNWRRAGSEVFINELDIKNRKDLLPVFVKSPGLFYLPGKNEKEKNISYRHYTDLLSKCRVFEIAGKIDFKKASDFISRKLEF